MQMIITSRRTLSSARAPVITNSNALTHGSSNKNFHPQNAKVLSRRVHANTLSMMGTKELGVMSAENLERRIKHLLVRHEQFDTVSGSRFTHLDCLHYLIQSLTTEAKLCIQDCDESTDTDFDEEFESAKMAVGKLFFTSLLNTPYVSRLTILVAILPLLIRFCINCFF